MKGYFSLISGFLLPVLQLLIIQRCITILLGSGNRKIAGMMAWFLYYAFLVTAGLGILFPPQFLLLGNILMIFVISTVTRKKSLKKRCISTLLICTVWMLVEVVVLLVLEVMGTNENIIAEAGSFISKICMLLFSVLLDRYTRKKTYTEIPLRYFIIILLVPASSIYMMHHIFLMAAFHEEFSFFSIVSGILLLLVNYVIFTVYDKVGEIAYFQARNHLYEQQLELCSRQTEERESHYLELRRMRHDMKNHLSGILGMVNAGHIKDADEYIQNMLNDSIGMEKDEISRTGNIVVDSLVNHKYALALKNNIQFETRVFIPSVLPFQNGHLAIIFGNLLENALEACQKLPEEQRYILLEATYTKEMLQICIKNSCQLKQKRDSNGRYLTTKEDASCHGIGLVSVEQALAEYDGELFIENERGEFRVSAVLYGNSIREK
ncbi:MAG: GHKL domain-containing protein [Spirochaetia bacterium]|nr:GHKL domain-containing protein [Spirochaetia bacterium]